MYAIVDRAAGEYEVERKCGSGSQAERTEGGNALIRV